MANQLPYQQDMHDHSIPDANGEVDIWSLPCGYLVTCVRFVQSRGIYPNPSPSSIDTDTGYDIPGALQEAQYQNTNHEVDHHEQNPGPSNGNYFRPEISNNSMDTIYSQHDQAFNFNPYMETRTTDPAYNNHRSSFPISDNHDMIIGPRLSQEHGNDQHQSLSLSATDATIRDRVSHFSNSAFIDHSSLAVVHNYDPLWVENTGAEPSSVHGFISRMKFEELCRSGVIQQGDRLVVAYTHAFSKFLGRQVATLTVCVVNLPPPFSSLTENFCFREQHVGFSAFGRIDSYPDLTLTLSSHPSYTQTLSACRGIDAILEAFAQCNVSGPGINAHLAKNLHVWRGDQNLGTLHFVRQAYHTWKNRILDAESERAGTA